MDNEHWAPDTTADQQSSHREAVPEIERPTAAEHSATVTGIDLAADPRRTGLAILRHDERNSSIEVTEARLGADDGEILTVIQSARMSGVDVPMGWPRPFTEFVLGHTAVTAEPPAAALRSWGLPHRGYKKPSARGQREKLADQMTVLFPRLSWNGFREDCVKHDDVLDAVIAALVANEAIHGGTLLPAAEDHALALIEGWIHLPLTV